jgi:hypothetical protein
MVKDDPKDIEKEPVKQGALASNRKPNEIGAATPYDFESKNLTAYGGLLPVATMLERLQFQELVLTGILKVLRLPPQSTFWRFLASLHLSVAGQLLKVQQAMRNRVWEAAHVQLTAVTLDTDTTVHTLFGHQMGARKGYNPKHRGKKSYQPILTFLAETREYVGGELHNGDRLTGKQIAQHLRSVLAALPPSVKQVYARADSGFYCWEALRHFGVQNIAAGGAVERRPLDRIAAHRRRRTMRVPLSAPRLGSGAAVRRLALPQEA